MVLYPRLVLEVQLHILTYGAMGLLLPHRQDWLQAFIVFMLPMQTAVLGPTAAWLAHLRLSRLPRQLLRACAPAQQEMRPLTLQVEQGLTTSPGIRHRLK